MPAVLIMFPPGSGGNHLRNLISTAYTDLVSELNKFYDLDKRSVHLNPGDNLDRKLLMQTLHKKSTTCLLHGHFGEFASVRDQIQQLEHKKFIVISPDTIKDRALLWQRQRMLGETQFDAESYFGGEQVFLYEPSMLQYYFNTSMDDFMHISITDWFVSDITPVIDRINWCLQINLDVDLCMQLHQQWLVKNNIL